MSTRDTAFYLGHLIMLAAVWGSSFMFIEVGLEELEPPTLVGARLLLATAALGAAFVAQKGPRQAWLSFRRVWKAVLILGVLNAAVPFTLVAWAQTRIDSGVAAITIASVPIFVVLLAIRFRQTERVTGMRLVGIVLGLAGVGVLAGVEPVGGLAAVVGILAATVASLCYAVSLLYAQIKLENLSPILIALATTAGGALLMLPWAAVEAPSSAPSLRIIGAVVALAVLATALAHAIFYRMLPRFGSTRSSLITYLVAPAALVYGTLLLDEPLTLGALLGLGLVLMGIGLGAGFAWRRAAAL